MSFGKTRASLSDGCAHGFERSREVACFKQHAAKLELRVGIAAVPLVERLAKRCGSLFEVAAPRKGYAEVVPGFRKFAVALLDCFIESINSFIEIAAPNQRQPQILISPRVIAAALFNRFAIGFNRMGVLAAPRERNAEAVISVGIFRL